MGIVSAIVVTALLFALTATVANFADARASRLHSPRGKFVTVGGAKLHYTDTGTGRCVVLLHGNGGTIADMEVSTLVKRLAESYRVLAFDRPGFGHSERPRSGSMIPEAQAMALLAAIKKITLGPVILVGHSYGALVAVACALDAPETVQGLVLVSGYLVPAHEKLALLKLVTTPAFGTLAKHCLLPIVARVISPIITRIAFSPLSAPSAFREGMPWPLLFRSDHLMTSLHELAEMHSSAVRIYPEIGTLRIPVVLLAGIDDKIVDTQIHTRALERVIPQSTVHLVPGVGHMLHHAQPDLVCAEVDRLWLYPDRTEG